MLIGGFEMIPAGKSSSEHEDGGFWGVKIGKQGVDNFKIKTWVDENIVFARGFASATPVFERASDGGAERNDAMFGGFGIFDGFDSIGWNVKPFGMHVMFFDIIGANRQESAKTNMKGEVFNLDAFLLEARKEVFGHVKASGWRSGAAELLSPNSLITLNVIGSGVAVKIRWKWNVAMIEYDVLKRTTGVNYSNTAIENFANSNGVVGESAVVGMFDS